MTKAIQQRVELPASPDQLFATYLDAKRHAAITGGKVTISQRVGGRFTAFGGAIGGRNLVVVPRRMIVQAWRARHWPKTDPDSILVLTFSRTRRGGRIDLVHVNVPRHDHAGVTRGWGTYYWRPWRTVLSKGRRRR